MKSRTLCLIALVSLAVAAPAPARAVEVPVGAFPADVSVVVRLADPTETLKKVKDLASGIDLGADVNDKIMTAIEGAAGFTGVMIDNPARQGIKPETDWWIAVIARKDAPPAMIYAVEASDAGALKDAVAEDHEFIQHDNWTIYTKDAEAAKSIKAVLAGDAKSIESSATDNIKSLFQESDAAAFVNLKSLKVTFADEVDEFRNEFRSTLDEVEAQMELQPIPIEGVDMKSAMKIYSQVFEGILTGLNDSNSFSAGVSIDGDGVLFREVVEFQPDSSSDKALRTHKPAAMPILAKLPADQLAYVGIHIDMKALTKWSVELSNSLLDLDDEQKAKMKASIEEMGKLDIGSTVVSFGIGDRRTGYLNTTSITEMKGDGVKEYRRNAFKMLQGDAGGGAKLGMFKSVEILPDAEKVGDTSVDQIRMEFDTSEIDPSGQMIQGVMTMLFGPDGMMTRVAYPPGLVVETLGGGPDRMAQALKRVASTPSPDAAFQATRTNLPDESNVIYMIDLPGLISKALQAVSENSPFLPVDLSELQSMDLKRSFLGFSISTGPAALKCRSYVPRDQIQGMGSLIQLGIKQFQMLNQGPTF